VISQAPEAGTARATAAPDSEAAILVVDDNLAKRMAIVSVLEPLGHTTIDAESGEAALQAVMEQTFAVILMDVRMPVMDGYETARLIRLRKQSERTPIIFLTAAGADEVEVPDAYASGAVDFIFAPIVPGILRAKVSIFVDLFLKSRELTQTLRDVTDLSHQFRDSEAHARAVLNNVAEGIITLSEDGVIESFNRAATGLFGYTEQDALGRRFSTLVDAGSDDIAGESVGRRSDGSTFPMELDLSQVQLGDRQIHIGCARDISERRSHTEMLQYQALHDALTGLPNRVLFGDRVNHAIRALTREAGSLALLVMDLDEFKQVNDTLGHQSGDQLLKLVTQRLLGCLRDGDTVARLGGDEFGILPIAGTDLAGAVTVAWKLQQALEAPFLVKDHSIDVSASIGITLVPDHGDNIDDLLRRADLAMYDAKRSGSGYAMFAAEHEDAPARRLALHDNLRHCVDRDELVLHYQPKIDLATRKTIGVEALVRWSHPSGELLMPSAFMPEVEHSELMIPITKWVVGEALNTLRGWRDEGYDLTMAVNLGARCLTQGTGIFETVDELVAASGVPPDKLTFELTESALIDTEVPGLLARLQDMDQQLSIDDFGTGYSSLLYLQQLPVAEIKADKSFVTTLASVDDDAVIVRSIIDLAHNLGVKVVAEGVEDEETMRLLIDYGCDAAQGYFFTRPVPGGELTEWLESSPFGAARRLAGTPS